MLSALLGIGIFLVCLFPLRALMNYHEEHHLFRWTGYYFREQLTSWDGFIEFLVSFITQFFYIGWLGAALLALLTIGIQLLTWLIMKKIHLGFSWLYPLSVIPAVVCLYLSLIPERYQTEEAFREVVEYDYLVRTHQWAAIVNKPATEVPATEQGVWCTNYALAMRGELPDYLFFFQQTGPQGLLTDSQQKEVLSYFSLSDIYLQLGLINDAERMAFDAKQYIPESHKSGRLYRRLAETNIINGDYGIAAKYLHFLQSTLFYGKWARNMLAHLGDEAYINQVYRLPRSRRQTENEYLAPPSKDILLLELIKQNPENKLAMDYLLAYELLQLKYNKVAEYMQIAQQQGYDHIPRAVQECIIGNRLLHQEEQPHLEFAVDEEIMTLTRAFFQTMNESKDVNDPVLNSPPFSQTYWHYHTQTVLQHSPQ